MPWGGACSCHRLAPGQGRRRPSGCPPRLPLCSRGHRDGAWLRQGQRAFEPLSLDIYTALFGVSTPACPSPCFLGLGGTDAQGRRGHFVEWMLERPDVAPVWDRFINHPFVMAMGNGSLPLESFKGYLVQDYLYLVRTIITITITPSRRCIKIKNTLGI